MAVGNRTAIRERLVPDGISDVPLGLSRATLLVLTVAFLGVRLAGVTVPLTAQAAVYLLGMVAMNLPHGGFEHVDNLRRRALAFQGRYVALYLGAIGAFVGLFFLAPVAGLALACGVAVAKGGHGGLRVMDATDGTDHIRSRFQRALAAAVRGGTVMVVPLVAWPDTFHSFSAIMVNIFEPGGLAAVSPYFDVTRPLFAGGFALLVTAHLGLGYWRGGDTRSFRVDAAETLLLVAYFVAVPVVVAVGLYFPLWYSMRQVARTAEVDAEPADGSGGLLAPLEADDPRLAALGAWGVMLAGAVVTGALAAGLWFLSPMPLGGAGLLIGLVAFWSIFVSIIALPHVVVGSWLDRERGIWYVP
jgi:Brp/Blh family beta-carotene 15,15'-monooxygenase